MRYKRTGKKGIYSLQTVIVSAIIVAAFGLFSSMLSKNWSTADENAKNQVEQTTNNTQK